MTKPLVNYANNIFEIASRKKRFDEFRTRAKVAFSLDGYSEPHRVFVSPEEKDDREKRRLVDVFVKSVFEDNDVLPSSSAHNGSPGGDQWLTADSYHLRTTPSFF